MTSCSQWKSRQRRAEEFLEILPQENLQIWEECFLKHSEVKTVAEAIRVLDASDKWNMDDGEIGIGLGLLFCAVGIPFNKLYFHGGDIGLLMWIATIVLYFVVFKWLRKMLQNKRPRFLMTRYAIAALDLLMEHASGLSTIICGNACIELKKAACQPAGARSWVDRLAVQKIAAEIHLDSVRSEKGRDAHRLHQSSGRSIECDTSFDFALRSAQNFGLVNESKEEILALIQAQTKNLAARA